LTSQTPQAPDKVRDVCDQDGRYLLPGALRRHPQGAILAGKHTPRTHLSKSPVIVRPQSHVTIVEVADFECPVCRIFTSPAWPPAQISAGQTHLQSFPPRRRECLGRALIACGAAAATQQDPCDLLRSFYDSSWTRPPGLDLGRQTLRQGSGLRRSGQPGTRRPSSLSSPSPRPRRGGRQPSPTANLLTKSAARQRSVNGRRISSRPPRHRNHRLRTAQHKTPKKSSRYMPFEHEALIRLPANP